MDSDLLSAYLAQGLSLGQIGVRVGRHPSTVAYWLKKHGLTANGHEKHGPREGIARAQLQILIDNGLSIRAIAERLHVSPSTVRYWLRKHDLQTRPGERRAFSMAQTERANKVKRARLRCERHGEGMFVRRPDGGYRCCKCAQEAVLKRRRTLRRTLVLEAGGRCALCGYDRHIAALQFHHLDPTTKAFGLSARGITRSLVELRAEASKCVLLCGNCHAEVEAGVALLPRRYSSRSASSVPG
jgi:transposase